ncbi:Uncharacterised protein [Raoultella terrigena]|uniref:Uncharacterized protein n=1 Tax=Raoultella terrigena TaxID=577 RepID=A0A3P8M297_RAOTE|nr:Uncharacterised protein [Raoultella terrigena]
MLLFWHNNISFFNTPFCCYLFIKSILIKPFS